MLSRRSLLDVSSPGTVRATLYHSLDVAGEELGKWVTGESDWHKNVFLEANAVVVDCLDCINGRGYLETGKDYGQIQIGRMR